MRYLIVLLLAGCASTSDVLSLGADRYTVTAKMSGPGSDWPEVRAMAMKAAEGHCASMGRGLADAELKNHGARGWSPISTDVTFRCR